jgi:hypothetical protein
VSLAHDGLRASGYGLRGSASERIGSRSEQLVARRPQCGVTGSVPRGKRRPGSFEERCAGVGCAPELEERLGRNYNAVYGHYGFDPVSRELNAIVKVRTSIRFGRDARTFTENGIFEELDATGSPLLDPNGEPLRGGFAATARRLDFF